MPKRQRSAAKTLGPKTSQRMSKHLAEQHHPACFEQYVNKFKKRFPTCEDAMRGFTPDMLAVDPGFGGPYSTSSDLQKEFRGDFAHLSDEQKQYMKDTHIRNYYSDAPKPMIFESGVTDVAGGEVLVGTRMYCGKECIVLKVLCKLP